MAPQQVEHHVRHVGMIKAEQPLDIAAKASAARWSDREKARLFQVVFVDVVADKEGDAGAGELIVHHGVPHVALQPPLGVGPDLADDVGFGVDRADPRAKLAPEGVVIDLVGHIEPPAIDAKFDPLPADPPEKLPHLGAVDIELGQGRQTPPGLIVGRFLAVVGVEREFLDREPVKVGRVGAVFHDVVELKETAAGVVEHAVEHHADTAGMGLSIIRRRACVPPSMGSTFS